MKKTMQPVNFFKLGFQKMLPITTGVIPFGAVMGTVFAEAKLSLFQSMTTNVFVYAGASQLAAMELMTTHAASLVVIATGLIINLRFILYSAALAPYLRESPFWLKFVSAHSLTDQSYAVMSANHDRFKTNHDAVQFYLGTATCMLLVWHLSTLAGYVFGNFAPAALSLDYAVPLSFVALLIPTLKNRKYLAVAVFSSVVAVLLNPLPYKIGLFLTALLSIGVASIISKKREATP